MICTNCNELASFRIFVYAHNDPEWAYAPACCACLKDVFRETHLRHCDEIGFREVWLQQIKAN